MSEKKKILIIDDDIMTLRILKKYLEGKYEILMENAGYRFVERPQDYSADLILLDIEMPVMNGLQVFEEYMKNPEHKDIPIVFLSGVSNPELVRDVIGKGASGYVVKTIPKAELLLKIEKFFKEFESGEEKDNVLIVDKNLDLLKKLNEEFKGSDYNLIFTTKLLCALETLSYKRIGCVLLGSEEMGIDKNLMKEKMSKLVKGKKDIFVLLEENMDISEIVSKVGEKFVEES